MKFREITKKTNINFIGFRNKMFVLSAVLVLLGFVMVFLGKANLSVDFTGGTELQIRFAEPLAIGDLRKVLISGGIEDVQIQEVAGKNDFFLKTKLMNTGSQRVQDKIGSLLSAGLPGKSFQVLGSMPSSP